MSRQLIKVVLLASLSLVLSLSQSSARPAARDIDLLPPNLSDTLAVAKSPLEPVTLALTLPDVARTDEQPLETTKVLVESDFSTTSTELVDEEKRTTRSAQSFFEQQSSSTTKGLEESAGLGGGGGDASTTQSVTTEASEEPTSATDAPIETETEAANKSSDNEPTTTLAPASSESSSTSQESTTTTTAPEPSVASDASSTTNTTTITTTTVAEEPTVTTTKEPETTTVEASTTTLAPSTTTSTTTTEPPTTTTSEAPTTASESISTSTAAENTDLRENEQPKEVSEETTTTTTTTTTLAPTESTETPQADTTTSQPTSESAEPTTTIPMISSAAEVEREQPVSSTESAPSPTTEEVTETTTPSPAPETPESTTASPTTTTTTATTTTTTATTNQTSTEEPKLNKEEDKPSCDHLPTYDSDEIQKVFREETTFRNGTIKGKFTYINFDQRYRLVHYTRLPYGPVKIDRVEELGKPKQNETNQSSAAAAPTLSDIPNAVLQLRNLLPNSLFGFPFLGPNSGARAQSPFVNPKENGGANGNDESNMYFYSTDSLSTPNLFNSRVPVSLLPGQRMKSAQTSAAPSSLSTDARNSFFGAPSIAAGPRNDRHQHPTGFGMPNPQDDYSKQLNKLDELIPPTPLRSDQVVPTSHQFQYSSPFAQNPSSPSAEKGIVFSYYTTHTHPAQYQYTHSSSSAYQPYPLRIHHTPVMTNPSIDGFQQQKQYHHAQAHQPHGHEHYMAPFMFAQPVEHQPQSQLDTSNNDNGSSRLRLKVKTSKALNVNQVGGTKSAQLRSNGHYSQVDSPTKVHQRTMQRQQQRLGKQNHQLLRPGPQSNPSPVVYHVLRNSYNHQYDQGYSMAYDHDN